MNYICERNPVIIDDKSNSVMINCHSCLQNADRTGLENEHKTYQTVDAFNYPLILFGSYPYVFIKIAK